MLGDCAAGTVYRAFGCAAAPFEGSHFSPRQVINPAGVVQQIQGGIVFGLSALKGGITIDKGRVQQGNFNTYEVLRIDEMPVIEVYLVPSHETPGGIGEASTPAIGPAVANALFAATGKRLRSLPIKPEHLV